MSSTEAAVAPQPRITSESTAKPQDNRLPSVADIAELPARQVRHELADRAARVLDSLTPLQARQQNLTLVCNALEEAGINYFAIPGRDDSASSIGIALLDRDRACATIKRLCLETQGYVTVLHPPPPVRHSPRPGGDKSVWDAMDDPRVVRVNWYWTEPTHKLVLGPEHGCDIEFWRRDAGTKLVSPRPNRVTRVVPVDKANTWVPGQRFTRLSDCGQVRLPPIRTREEFDNRPPDSVDFPIDVVYTWVDGTDPVWQRRRAQASGQVYHEESASAARYISRDELKYSLRSLYLYAPWVRNIFIVSDNQAPPWLNTDHPQITVVDHQDIFADTSVLPVYNSHAIESQLHHIAGLSEQFLYFNDDMFLGQPVSPQKFFAGNGLSKFFHADSHVPIGPITPADTPVDAACKNNRRLLHEVFGKTIAQTFQHAPYSLRRDVMADIESRFQDDHQNTAASRFRDTHDISIPSSLQHYFGYFTGRAMPGSIRSVYIQLAVKDLQQRLDRLLARRDADTFCLNDAFSTEDEIDRQNAILVPFLEAYFAVPSPYELRPEQA